MANPLAETKKLVHQLADAAGIPLLEAAQRIEAVTLLLQRYTPEELGKAAEMLDAASNAQDTRAACDAARVEIQKQPRKPGRGR